MEVFNNSQLDIFNLSNFYLSIVFEKELLWELRGALVNLRVSTKF